MKDFSAVAFSNVVLIFCGGLKQDLFPDWESNPGLGGKSAESDRKSVV